MKTYRIMILNLGSTSFKFKYYPNGDKADEAASGVFENIGKPQSDYRIKIYGQTETGTAFIENHRVAFDMVLSALVKKGVLHSLKELDAVCYKAVHGGDLTGIHQVNDHLLKVMRRYIDFAPAHNTVYCDMMEKMREKYPDLLQLACFETSFHATIPQKRVLYGVPWEWMEDLGIRRYGFHGSSHRYIAEKMWELAPECTRVISLHLGGSSSVCAIENSKSIACSMGATPQSGLFQNNRVGDLDVFCLPALIKKYNNVESVFNTLSKESGLLGVSGVSNDLRDIINAAERGNFRAQLAIEAFCDNIIGYIGMFSAYLKGTQAIVFTGGIGRNSVKIRKMVCNELAYMGVLLDDSKNELNAEGIISRPDSKVLVFALETNEEYILVKESQRYLDSL